MRALLFAACTAVLLALGGPGPALGQSADTTAAAEVYRVLLVGDTGAPRLETADPVLQLLEAELARAGAASAVVFLGDNLYPHGLPPEHAPARPLAEARMDRQLAVLDGYEGRVVFIPGNHDWASGGPGGLDAVQRQEAYIETALNRGDVFLPSNGTPGPAVVDLTDYVRLIVLDTQWWLHPHDKALGSETYDVEGPGSVLVQLRDEILRSDDHDVLVVGHHPLTSRGEHAGYAPLRHHLFPLTVSIPGAYIPLPGLGSLPWLYKRTFGFTRQDLAAPRYEQLRTALADIFSVHDGLVYAAGHDHSLQYFHETIGENTQTHLVSGSASRLSFVAPGRDADFTAQQQGLMRLHYFDDGSVRLTIVVPSDSAAAEPAVLFSDQLEGPERERIDLGLPTHRPAVWPDYRDSTVTMAVNAGYQTDPMPRWLIGGGHREAWATPVEVPVLDLSRAAGGLTLVKRGGGAQTRSLRLRDAEGREYVLRSIDKDPTNRLPESLQYDFAYDIAEDLTSALHPFGALLVPPLAEAAGVYHTHPRIVFVPDDPRLGIYRDDFRGQLMLLEMRPDEDLSAFPNFGNSSNVIGTPKLLQELAGDNDHRVDQESYARGRLFDMLIGDWDRHADQWRWASYEPYELDTTLTGDARTQGKIYRPIPRDRDWAFNLRDGLAFRLARPFLPKIQGFTPRFVNLQGLTLNGLQLDRRFTNQLREEDWTRLAADLQAALPDSILTSAVQAWPDPIAELDSAWVVSRLLERRDQLVDVARNYYDLHARVVDVVGSNKHERFNVERRPDGTVRVAAYKMTDEGELVMPIYDRTFLAGETEEIRLYGLGGNDLFRFTGRAPANPRILAIGGAGEDRFVDDSVVRGPGRKTHIYDTPQGTTWEAGPETRVTRSEYHPIGTYRPAVFYHDQTLPTFFFDANKGDGLFVGGGVKVLRHGFRKDPFARRHRLRANIAPLTAAFNVEYDGLLTDVLGEWDVGAEVYYRSPNYFRNYYGLGNESPNTEAAQEYYRARLASAGLRPFVRRHLQPGVTLEVGVFGTFTRVREDDDRFIATPQAGVSPSTFQNQWFAGPRLRLEMDNTDRGLHPTNGFRLTTEGSVHLGLRDFNRPYGRIDGALSVYLTPRPLPWFTVALRVGGTTVRGRFPFYDAPVLGSRSALRGYRFERFAGRSRAYQNTELRLRLKRFRTYLLYGETGVYGFLDTGRVWTDGELSSVWHQGYGLGAWLNAADQFVLRGAVGFSVEDYSLTAGLGFLF